MNVLITRRTHIARDVKIIMKKLFVTALFEHHFHFSGSSEKA